MARKRKTKNRAPNAYLPLEIVHDILLRLPAMSLQRFKSVCKPWRAIISAPHFVKMHLDLGSNRLDGNFTLICFDKVFPSPSLISVIDLGVVKFNNPFKDYQNHPGCCIELWGSCNGLFLLSSHGETLLWNPCTREHNKISNTAMLESNFPLNFGYRIFGLGYDSSSDEYKGIIAYGRYPLGGQPGFITSVEIEVSICTSKTGTWGTKKYFFNMPYSICGTHVPAGVTVNGSPHWVVYRMNVGNRLIPAIMYFDCADEVFKEVPCPDLFNSFSRFDAGVLGGSLCVVDDKGSHEYDVWVMKEYGVEPSWTKLCRINLPVASLKPLGFKKNGEVLILLCGWELLSYNLKTGREEDSMFSYSLFSYGDTAVSYLESLASPSGALE